MKFKPADFGRGCDSRNHQGGHGITDSVLREYAASIANAKLETWLKKAPIVSMASGYGDFDAWVEDDDLLDLLHGKASHTARLVCIEKIKK